MRGLPRGPIAALIAFALAAMVYIFGIRMPAQPDATVEGWVETSCEVVHMEISSGTVEEPWGNGMREYTVYIPAVTLEYTYNGKTYTFVEKLPPSRDGKEAARRQKAWVDVPDRTCLVNPQFPAQARIPSADAPPPALRVATMMGAGLLVIIGVLALIAPFFIPKELGHEGPPPEI